MSRDSVSRAEASSGFRELGFDRAVDQRHGGAVRGRLGNLDTAVELLGERFDNAGAEAVRRPFRFGRSLADAVVGDGKPPVRPGHFVGDQNRAGLGLVDEGVLQRIDHQLGDDESDADRLVGRDPAVARRTLSAIGRLSPIIDAARLSHSLGEIGADLDLLAVPGGVQLLLHCRHRHDPLVGVLEMAADSSRADGARLQQQDAGDDLQAVGDAMLHLPQQRFLLLQEFGRLALRRAPLGDVLDGQENQRAGVFS